MQAINGSLLDQVAVLIYTDSHITSFGNGAKTRIALLN
jgi:hypothetical protein